MPDPSFLAPARDAAMPVAPATASAAACRIDRKPASPRHRDFRDGESRHRAVTMNQYALRITYQSPRLAAVPPPPAARAEPVNARWSTWPTADRVRSDTTRYVTRIELGGHDQPVALPADCSTSSPTPRRSSSKRERTRYVARTRSAPMSDDRNAPAGTVEADGRRTAGRHWAIATSPECSPARHAPGPWLGRHAVVLGPAKRRDRHNEAGGR